MAKIKSYPYKNVYEEQNKCSLDTETPRVFPRLQKQKRIAPIMKLKKRNSLRQLLSTSLCLRIVNNQSAFN